MSGGRYKEYDGSVGKAYRELNSDDSAERERAERARVSRLNSARERIDRGEAPPPPKRETREVYDRSLAKNKITSPAANTKSVHIVLIDNSGSNRQIAEHLKKSSGYLLSILGIVDPTSQVAFIYFSDHCDGNGLMQEVDYVSPGEKGDKILHSSIAQVTPAGGGDEPEAIECALWSACDIDFGDVQQRHLYLVTDVVAHGMGMREDDGCPEGRDWKESLARVRKTFRSFEVIGSGKIAKNADLQRKFVADDRVGLDFMDLREIPTHEHRCGITGNALLFFIARRRGMQCVEAFLMTLYEKWLTEPIFGANTDLQAREAIARFVKYLDIDEAAREKMLERIFD